MALKVILLVLLKIDLNIKNSKLEITVDENNSDAKTFLESVNYIIDGVEKISPMLTN